MGSRLSIQRATDQLIEEFRARPPLRAGSLIVTVFGDAIAPRGGSVWIGSLIGVMAGFGVSERLVRTSVFRLSGDGWLEARSKGRRSYYGLTADGAERFQRATDRIYGQPRRAWKGEWCLVLLGGVSAADRDLLRREMGWMGFGAISAGVLAHPAPDRDALRELLDAHGASSDVVVISGQSAGPAQDRQLCALASKSWNLADIEQRYADFVARFTPVSRSVSRSTRIDPERAFRIRTLLIQEYRKILLRDPLLPVDLLPDEWHGLEAYRLCRSLYRSVYAAAEEFLSENLQTADGPLPSPVAAFYGRFGGLS